MRTAETIQEQIGKLKARQAELDERCNEYMGMQTNPHFEKHDPLWKVSETLARWSDEQTKIEDQLRVLYWVSGKFEHFPWR